MPVTIITITPFLGQFDALAWDIGCWGGRRHDHGLLMPRQIATPNLERLMKSPRHNMGGAEKASTTIEE